MLGLERYQPPHEIPHDDFIHLWFKQKDDALASSEPWILSVVVGLYSYCRFQADGIEYTGNGINMNKSIVRCILDHCPPERFSVILFEIAVFKGTNGADLKMFPFKTMEDIVTLMKRMAQGDVDDLGTVFDSEP